MTGTSSIDMPTTSVRPLSDQVALLGESPVYSPFDNAVWWVDIEGRKLLRTGLSGATTSWTTPEIPGFVQIARDGRAVVGMERGIYGFDPKSGVFTLILPCPQSGTRFNDCCTDQSGTLWAGTMDLANTLPVGVLYRIGPDGPPEAVMDGFITINGLAVDDTRGRLYVSDSHPSVQTVWVCDLVDGRPVNRRVLASFHDLPGRPDGALLDRDGGYWIAAIGGGQLASFAPDGTPGPVLPLPFASPTKPAFAGPDGALLVVTSRADDRHDGRLAAGQTRAMGIAPAPQHLCALGAR